MRGGFLLYLWQLVFYWYSSMINTSIGYSVELIRLQARKQTQNNMAVETDTQLKARAAVIAAETAIGGNTKTRVATLFTNIVDSKISLKSWTFADNADAFPVSDAPTLYIVQDDHGSLGDADYVPAKAWMIALT